MRKALIKQFFYNSLLQSIDHALQHARNQASAGIIHTILQTYWEIGRNTEEYEQKSKKKRTMAPNDILKSSDAV